MKSHNSFLVLSFGILFTVVTLIYGLTSNEKKESTAIDVVTSKCDSLYSTNDSLSKRLIKMNRELNQYRTGAFYLKDKDKEAYDYMINAGNLKFDDGL
jgi:hypothetical protein